MSFQSVPAGVDQEQFPEEGFDNTAVAVDVEHLHQAVERHIEVVPLSEVT